MLFPNAPLTKVSVDCTCTPNRTWLHSFTDKTYNYHFIDFLLPMPATARFVYKYHLQH